MTDWEKWYYGILLFVLILGFGYFTIPKYIASQSTNTEHYMGANINCNYTTNICTYTWLGGWDYESFAGDIRINGTIWKHPPPGTIIAVDKNPELPIEVWMKPVNSWITLSYK